ncbi:MAG TPA: hypothetical protein VK589_10465 [Chryseolinea sp.]|nr:hypothetical protein [Chryseolinea sp.]
MVFAVVVSAAKVWGQAAPSPFTTYGVGEPYGYGLVHNQGNGLGVSQPQYWYVNNQNPALLIYNNYSVFQVGIVGESRTAKGDTTNEKNSGGNLNYIVMAFPIKPDKWTSSLGLMPYTDVNFSFQYPGLVKDPLGAVVDTLTTSESGSGGLTQVYWSNGVRLTKEIAVGLKAAYLFGPVSNLYSNLLSGASTPGERYVVSVEDKSNNHGFNFGLGFSFSRDSLGRRNDRRVSIGAVYNFASNLKSTSNTKIFRTTLGGDTVERYTIESVDGTLHLPQGFSAGISYGKGVNWSIGTEFAYQDWASFESIRSDDQGLGKSWRTTVGGEFTMDPLALESYLKRITFRTGVSFEQYPFLANNNVVKDYGINFGFSLPAGRSSMDFAVKLGKRGNRKENIIEESYFKLYFGITFNDQWFIKRKFD